MNNNLLQPEPLRIPLDHNFPEPILVCLDQFITDVRLIPIRLIDPRLPELEDRQLLIALHQLGFRALVTMNYRMLDNARELAAILKTKISVFAIEEAGHDPLMATGILLFDLPGAIRRYSPGRAQVFRFRHNQPRPVKSPWNDEFVPIAQRMGRQASELYDEVRVSNDEITTPVLNQ